MEFSHGIRAAGEARRTKPEDLGSSAEGRREFEIPAEAIIRIPEGLRSSGQEG